MTTLQQAAQAVLDRWNSPKWDWHKQGPTADLMHTLQAAIAQSAQPAAVQPLTDFDLRGLLASELLCWHRLSAAEAENLLAFASAIKAQAVPAGMCLLPLEPIAWESTSPGLVKYVSNRRHKLFSSVIQAYYKPCLGASCITPDVTQPDEPLSMSMFATRADYEAAMIATHNIKAED